MARKMFIIGTNNISHYRCIALQSQSETKSPCHDLIKMSEGVKRDGFLSTKKKVQVQGNRKITLNVSSYKYKIDNCGTHLGVMLP